MTKALSTIIDAPMVGVLGLKTEKFQISEKKGEVVIWS
jgi:hypothetical protein